MTIRNRIETNFFRSYTGTKLLLVFTILSFLTACKSENQSEELFEKEMNINRPPSEIYAWCIVPYDVKKRSPKERILMLKELGIAKYVYDWRQNDLPLMEEELKLARENDIEIKGVWIWIDNDWDKAGKLNKPNEIVFEIIEKLNLSTQIWVGFNPNFYQGLTDQESIAKGAEIISFLCDKADRSNSQIALYNHGDWFGEPLNQLKIIEKLPDEKIGIIYNFHHAHNHIDRFEETIEKAIPFLWAVSLNGMNKNGPKILPLGSGESEKQMIAKLFELGYKGDFGIIGHVEERDVRDVLVENINGYFRIMNVINKIENGD